jgi:NAD(P)-dependent dehydrogenase (short-subunit alcohol dehydrogenase family)
MALAATADGDGRRDDEESNMNESARRLLVVGASSGIGRSVASLAAADGWHVVGAARRWERLQRLDGVHAVRADVRDPMDCESVVAAAVDHLGGLDHVVVAAGIADFRTVVDTDAAGWQRLLETNVVGPALVARAAIPHLRPGHGRLVLMSSLAASRPPPGMIPYAVSKQALQTLAAGLQDEEPDIDVCCVVLGPTYTEITAGWDRDLLVELFARWRSEGFLPPPGQMDPDDVAEHVLTLLALPFRVAVLSAMPLPKSR